MVVVITIIGSIVSVIWAKATDVMLANNVRVANRQVIAIAHGVRYVFAEQGGVRGTTSTLPIALDQLKVFPLEMRADVSVPNGVIYHHWYQLPVSGQGSVLVEAATCLGVPTGDSTTAAPCFNIYFSNVPANACTQILLSSTQVTSTGGLVGLSITNSGGTNPIQIPTDLETATNACAGSHNKLTWTYLLKDNG